MLKNGGSEELTHNRLVRNMEKYTFISFLCSIAFIYMGVYTIRLEPYSKLNRIFLILCTIWAWWSLTYSYVFMSEKIESVWFWYRLSAIGWCNFPGLTLHFVLILTGIEDFISKKILYPVLYMPGLIFTALVFSPIPLVAMDFVRIDGIWFEIANNGILAYIFPVFYSSYALTAFAIPLVKNRSSLSIREKKLGLIFSTSILATLIPGVLVNNLSPLLEIRIIPAIGYCFGLIWIAGMTFAIIRYKFMSISASLAADAIMGRIKDSIILTDPEGKILRANQETIRLLGFPEEALLGRHVSFLADNPGLMSTLITRIKMTSDPASGEEVMFRSASGDTIPLSINGSSVKDGTGDVLGMVIAGFDLRPRKKLEALNDELMYTNRKLQEARIAAERDMLMAINVQSDLFPQSAPKSDEWDTAFYFQPAAGISGDMFDFYVSDGKLLGVSLFDVSGHGISSGLITVLAKSVIARNFHRHTSLRLPELMKHINDDLIEDIGGLDHYLTGILLRLRDDVVEYVNAGHPDLLYKKTSPRKVMSVKQRGKDEKSFFLGVRGVAMEYDCIRFRVFPGDTLLLFSDALMESKNTAGELFGMNGISSALMRAPEGSASEILNSVIQSRSAFGVEGGRPDDLTVMVLKRR